MKIAGNRHTLARFHAPWLIAVSWLVGCGARTSTFDWEEGAGGSSGSGGSSFGGKGQGGSAGKGSGGSSSKGGSSSQGGSGGCDLPGCGFCNYAGTVYQLGQQFPAGDGCNTCTCMLGGSVSCTQIYCDSCSTLQNEYYMTVQIARSCDPSSNFNQCSVYVNSSPYCGCPTFANVNQVTALDNLFGIESRFISQGCASGVLCEPCESPSYAFCGLDGACLDVY